MSSPNSTFEKFVKERTYLSNVTPRTIDWYEQSWQWLSKVPLTEEGLKRFVIEMREAGLKPISCNSQMRFSKADIPIIHFGIARDPTSL